MQAVKLQVLHNFWSHIYDFTPKPGNWKTLGPEFSVQGLLAPMPEEAVNAFGKHGKEVTTAP